MKAILCLVIAGIVLTSCQYKDTLQGVLSVYADNPAEEFVEDIIEDATGIDLDITGESEE